jgi:sugar phosphate permease
MAVSPEKKVLSFRWLIFLVLALAYFFVYFHRLSLSVVANDLMQDFHASAGVMGLLGSVYFYCYAVMQFPAGLLSDSLGPRKTVTSFLLLAAVGSLLFGFAPTINMAFIGRVMVGFGVSMVFIPTMKILSQWFRTREFALMAGILNAVGGLGVMAATWLLALMTRHFGWRLSFELIGIITFLLVALVWLIVRDHPADRGWPSLAEIDHQGEGTAPVTAKIGLWEGAGQVVSEKYFWPVAIWFFFDCGIFFGFGALWSGPYLMHVYGLSRAEAGAILSMIAWGMIFGSPLLGFLSERIVHSRKKVLMVCMSVLTVEFFILFIYPVGLPRAALYVIFFLFSFCSSAVVVIGFTTTKELFPAAITGTSVGTVNLFPFFGGAIFMPLLGKVLDAYPKTAAGGYALEAYTKLLLILAISSLICLFCTFVMKETYHSR